MYLIEHICRLCVPEGPHLVVQGSPPALHMLLGLLLRWTKHSCFIATLFRPVSRVAICDCQWTSWDAEQRRAACLAF